jgi:hypothetical protein
MGPGSLRIGHFIGQLGVVQLPAVQIGLNLDERVVRRHVASLEAASWLERATWIWGTGSVVWLTDAGLQGTGLGGIRAVRSPPSPTNIAHGILVAWSAARAQRRGRQWKSARELALDPDRWAVRMRDERGYRTQLPDLAVWPRGSELPVALIGETGQRRADRQRMILEGWRNAIWSGQYAAVRYDCASASVAQQITRLAAKVHLREPEFVAVAQNTAEQIATIFPAAEPDPPPPEPRPSPTVSEAEVADHSREISAAGATEPRGSVAATKVEPRKVSEPAPAESPEAVAERERAYREIFGILEPKPRRRWRR